MRFFDRRDAHTFPARAAATFAFACALVIAAACPPSAGAADAAAWWSSIVLSALPYVAAGACAARLVARFAAARGAIAAAWAALVMPGCDCGMNAFGSALRDAPPGLTGFALTWGAVAGPVALIATHRVLGDRVFGARLAGALVASALTALLWRAAGRPAPAHECARPIGCDGETTAGLVCGALAALAGSAAIATAALCVAHWNAGVSSPAIAALAGALLSPCSTSDAVLARVLAHDRASQAAFVVAAQCADVRRIFFVHRAFGARRALSAFAAGCAGCLTAALVA